MNDPVAEAVSAVLAAQRAKGLAKYGTTLYGAKLTTPVLLGHAIEEVADLLNYLVATKMQMEAEAQSCP